MKYVKPSKIKKVPLEAQPSLRVPVRSTQPRQFPKNKVETRPCVWFVALKWQITIFLHLRAGGKHFDFRPLSPPNSIYCATSPLSCGPQVPFSVPGEANRIQRAANSWCWTPWEILTLPVPHRPEMPFLDQSGAAFLFSTCPKAPLLSPFHPLFPQLRVPHRDWLSSLTRGDVSVLPLKSPPPSPLDQHPPLFHPSLLSRCKCEFKCKFSASHHLCRAGKSHPWKGRLPQRRGKNENNGSAAWSQPSPGFGIL